VPLNIIQRQLGHYVGDLVKGHGRRRRRGAA
jgi:hypothetical protein